MAVMQLRSVPAVAHLPEGDRAQALAAHEMFVALAADQPTDALIDCVRDFSVAQPARSLMAHLIERYARKQRLGHADLVDALGALSPPIEAERAPGLVTCDASGHSTWNLLALDTSSLQRVYLGIEAAHAAVARVRDARARARGKPPSPFALPAAAVSSAPTERADDDVCEIDP